MSRDDLLAALQRLGACSEATSWVRSQSGSAYDLWRRCERGDWLLWLAARAGVDRRLVVLAACDCAEPALVYVPAGEERPRAAIETARRWARGEATLWDVRRAAADAADAYAAYAYVDAASAAYAAAYAAADAADAYAADAYVDAAAYASYAAADAAAYASYAAADAARARARSLAEAARLVRRRVPWSAVRDGLSGGES